MRRICVILMLFTLGGISMSAQSFEEYKRQMLETFADYRSQKKTEFDAYRDKVNSEFIRFMRQAWKKYNGAPALKAPPEIPDVPPVVLPDLEAPELPDNEVPYVDVVPLTFEDISPIPLITLPDEPKEESEEDNYVEVDFYGTKCRLRFDMTQREWLGGISEASVADMWEAMCSGPYETLLLDCLLTRKDMVLCDWAYYKFVDSVAKAVYGNSNESAILSAFIMNQSGYQIKIARSNSGTFHLLIGTADGIYKYPSFYVKGQDYYLVDGSDISSLYIFDMDFPKERAIRLSINESQRFAKGNTEIRNLKSKEYPDASVQVEINKNLLEFYNDYPHPYKSGDINASWMFYAIAPFEAGLKEALLQPLASSIAGKTQEESANIILNFVQTGFDYQTDNEQWGYERPFFPEETMYYPYSDCEDRAILYARLVYELLHLDVVFLYYPGHLATAVRFDEEISGDYILIGGDKYLVCDPTYINAPIGMQMPGLEESAIKVIKIADYF